MDEAMALMNIGGKEDAQGPPQGPPQGRGRGPSGPPQQRGPPPGRGGGYADPDSQRQDSGHFEGQGRFPQSPPRGYPQQRPPPMNMDGPEGRPGPRINPASPTRQGFPAPQRSVTMPPNMSAGGTDRGYPYDSQQGNAQQWVEPGPVAGYHGPQEPAYIPPRPATASGTKSNGLAEQQQHQPPPAVPQIRTHQPPQQPNQQHQQAQDDGHGDLDNFYDDYYGESPVADRASKATSIDMPNFDAIPEESATRHRRGYSIENHLSPTAPVPATQSIPPPTAGPAPNSDARQNDFYQQAARSRSQPDLHDQYSQNGAYEMAADAPDMPPLPRANTIQGPVGLPSGPRGRGPPQRAMTMGTVPEHAHPNPGYGSEQQQHYDPRYQQQQAPMQRNYSDQSAYSEPGMQAMRNGPPMAGTPIQRPGTAAPGPGRMPTDPIPRRPGTTQPAATNPDALPAHPAPVRPGLMQQRQEQAMSPQSARPPPVRQYHTDPTPGGYTNSQPSVGAAERRASVPHPVTHDELNRLRNTWKANPADHATGLQLAKKLVEAASVLADEGGTADNRTRNKNREKFIMEAHKTVKKLVHSGSPDAMFYLADCYGSGGLGLQVDTKEAFSLYQSAAKAGHAAAAYRTAVCCEMGHEEGGGTKKDPLKAVQWYRRAAALGDTAAMYKMGMILLKGLLGQQKNLGEAINMLKRAADRADADNPHALHELGLLYEAQTGNERIIRDEAYAAQLFMQAAELGYKFSQFRLGQAYEYGLLGYPVDARSSIAWYTRAASQEEHQSELALSGWYLTGYQGILEQSDTEAYLWARKAACAEPPLPKALFAMGYFTEVGIGCPRSLEEAKRWYGRAAGESNTLAALACLDVC